MFNKVKNQVDIGEVHNAFSLNTQIIGKIITKDDMRFDGSIKGDITSEKKLVVGKQASIEGNIHCSSLDSLGEIVGDVFCEGTVILRAQSILKGNITTKALEIEPSAIFDGSCKMSDPIQGKDE